jgi:cell division topological specificity factor
MLDNFTTFLKKKGKKEPSDKSKNAAKERLHLVLMQDRANVSADFLEMMKLEIVDVIKKYIDVDETDMDVKLENRVNEDGTSGAPALYANIPIVGINEEKKKESNEITKAKQAENLQENIVVEKKEDGKIRKKAKATKKSVSVKKSIQKIEDTTKKVVAKRGRKPKAVKENEEKEKAVTKKVAKKKEIKDDELD